MSNAVIKSKPGHFGSRKSIQLFVRYTRKCEIPMSGSTNFINQICMYCIVERAQDVSFSFMVRRYLFNVEFLGKSGANFT